jgi:hypothetical protein
MIDRQEIIGDPALPSGAREPSQDVSALRASPPIALAKVLAAAREAVAYHSAGYITASAWDGNHQLALMDALGEAIEGLDDANIAQVIEAQRAETQGGSVHESAVANGDAPKASS